MISNFNFVDGMEIKDHFISIYLYETDATTARKYFSIGFPVSRIGILQYFYYTRVFNFDSVTCKY